MNIVLDTNVFISGIFFDGPPSEILNAWKHSRIQIFLSTEILEEYQRVAEELTDKFPTIDILPTPKGFRCQYVKIQTMTNLLSAQLPAKPR